MSRITVIGGGPGGYTAAFAAAKAGVKVTMVEALAIGGTCLNWGCIPTKTLRASADALEMAHRLAEFGIEGIGEARANMQAVLARKERVIGVMRKGLEKKCASLGINFLQGHAALQGANRVLVSLQGGITQEVESDFIIIATGSRTLDLPSLPVNHTNILSSDDALNMAKIPPRLIIVGGGVIGSEMAFIYQSFGSKVTIVEGQNRLLPLPSVDEEVSKLLLREAKKKGIATVLGSTVQHADVQPDGTILVTIGVTGDNAKEHSGQKIEVDAVLVTVGRVPQTQGLGIEQVGVATDARGWITVNEYMQTSVSAIFAVGDVLGPAHNMLAHVAAVEGLCAVANCLGKKEQMDYRNVPSVIFTNPEVGSVGLSAQEAREKGYAVKSSLFHMRELGKAQAMNELAGFFKIVAEEGTGKILGVHITGAHATDLIAEATLALSLGATVYDVTHTIHAHPTLAEGVFEACLALSGQRAD